jgi:hypothetical protein
MSLNLRVLKEVLIPMTPYGCCWLGNRQTSVHTQCGPLAYVLACSLRDLIRRKKHNTVIKLNSLLCAVVPTTLHRCG